MKLRAWLLGILLIGGLWAIAPAQVVRAATPVELVTNGSFEDGTGTQPAHWGTTTATRVPAPHAGIWSGLVNPTNPLTTTADLPITGYRYRFSVWTLAPTGSAHAVLYLRDQLGQQSITHLPLRGGSDGFVQTTLDFEADPLTWQLAIEIWDDGTDAILVDDVSLQALEDRFVAEDFHSGLASWSQSGTGASTLCEGGPHCVLELNPTCCVGSTALSRTVGLPIQSPIRFAFAFSESAAGSQDVRVRFRVTFTSGAFVELNMTDPNPAWNGVSIGTENSSQWFSGWSPRENSYGEIVITPSHQAFGYHITPGRSGGWVTFGSSAIPLPSGSSTVSSLDIIASRPVAPSDPNHVPVAEISWVVAQPA